MESIYLPLAIDANKQPLNIEKQMAIALVRATGREVKIKSGQLIGWPLTLVKNEKNGGYIIFDQTMNITTKLQFTILQNYDRTLSTLQNSKNEAEILALLKSFKWHATKGYEEMTFRGLVNNDITPILSTGSPQLPVSILQKEASQFDLDTLLQDLNLREKAITDNILIIESVISKVTTIITILKGKRAEERKQIEDKYDQLISAKKEELKHKMLETKKKLESELSSESKRLYDKLADIEVLIAKTEIDKEAGLVSEKDLEALALTKVKYINEINSSITNIKNKYKNEVRNLASEINLLNQQKQKELEDINNKIIELDNLLQNVVNQLSSIKRACEEELNKLKGMYKRAPYLDEKVDVIVPFLLVKDFADRAIAIGTQVYKYKKSFFGFFKKEPHDIAENFMDLNEFVQILESKYSQNMADNLKQLKRDLDKGLEELYDEGWNVRRRIEEYYI
ncbi:hypothetical protein [Stygiolobus caldivivus]|uniref:Uncharacterized protein n=1 Tax=Stygiolobus caldivivus TaxID=2824673 RepID=A0A8D5U5K4_9CREN|nr:hypothetical protein [Stygiolobus caldivivus]BCU69291.1 hypothetical protein KN1_05880 [Stygiolobus caldivivus]